MTLRAPRIVALPLLLASLISIPKIADAQVDAKAKTFLVSQMTWDTVPSAAQLLSLYPTRARQERVETHSKIRCSVNETGGLEDCALMQEGPPMGYDFGIASIKAASLYKMHVTDQIAADIRNGGISIVLPFTWTLPPPS